MRGWLGWWLLVVPAFLSLLGVPVLEAHAAATVKGGRRPAAGRQAGAPPAGRGLPHVVRPGETLWGIAREHGVSVAALARANRLSRRATLRVGQRLVIPLGAVPRGSQEPPSLANIVLARPAKMPPLVLARPVPGAVASPFGPRGRAWHGGVDLRAARGEPIAAAADGLVVMSGWERAYGRVIKIWHFHGLMTVYAHNLENLVKVGDWVEQGQVIATVGSTGRATAPHLHFEVRLDNRKYDPLFWIGDTVVEATAPESASSQVP